MASRLGSAVHIQTDVIRSMIPAPVYTRAEARFVYEAMFLVGLQALKSGYDAILDATFLREDYRSEARRKLGGYAFDVFTVCVLCDPRVAMARNAAREPAVPEASLRRLAASFERPEDAIFVRSDRVSPEKASEAILRRVIRSSRKALETGPRR